MPAPCTDRLAEHVEVLVAQLVCAHRADRRRQPCRADEIGHEDGRQLDRLDDGPHEAIIRRDAAASYPADEPVTCDVSRYRRTVTTAAEILTSRFGYTDFRPGQQQVVEALLAGRSALAVFPTGGGQVPLLPAAGAAARRRDAGRLAADRADEGPDRLARPPGRRRGPARFDPRRRPRCARSPTGCAPAS